MCGGCARWRILLGQARGFLKTHGLATLNWSDNAAAAREVARLADPAEAALASEIAAEIYGLDVLAAAYRGPRPQHHPLPGHGAARST